MAIADLCRRLIGRGHLQSHGHPLPLFTRHLCMSQADIGPPNLGDWSAKFWLHNRIVSLGRAKEREFWPAERAEEAVKEFRSAKCLPTLSTCNQLMYYLVTAGRYADAISTFQFMTHAGLTPNLRTFQIFDLYHGQNHDVPAASHAFSTLCASHGLSPSSFTFYILISAQLELTNYDAAMQLCRERLRIYDGAPTDLYSDAIEGFVEGGSMDHATELYHEMRKRDEVFHELMFCNLIRGYFVAGRVSEAMEVFEFVPHKAHRTVRTYNAVLQGMCATGRFKEAEDFLTETVSTNAAPDADSYADSYAILMGGLVGQGKVDEAVRVLEVYKSSSEDVSDGAVVYNVVLEAYLKAGRLSDCEEIVREMAEKRIVLIEESYDLLIHGFCRRGWVEECLRLLRRLPDRHYYFENTLLFPYLCDVGKMDEIRELLEAYVNENLHFLPLSCNMFLQDIGNEERADEVRRIFQDVLEKTKGVPTEEDHVATEDPNLQTQVLNAINGGKPEIEGEHLGVTKTEVPADM